MVHLAHTGQNVVASKPMLMRGQAESYQRLVTASVAIFIFCGMISFFEPSPYDFASIVAILLWFVGGFRVNTFLIGVIIVWTLREIVYYVALAPYWEQPDPVKYQLQSSYLYVTVVFFTLYFAERAQERAASALNAYMYSCFVSSSAGILAFFGVLPSTSYISDRIAGTFIDPNVFGSYLTLGLTLSLQGAFIRHGRAMFLSAICLAFSAVGVFLSYSRGSWGAGLAAMAIVTLSTFLTYRGGIRKRVIFLTIAFVVGATIALVIALSIPSVSETFFQRLTFAKDYDVGDNGRWGNQLRSLPMLLERPLGFGPLRYRLWFELDPHNSYIGAFANAGWLAGFLWILIVLMTGFVGTRLMIVPTPFRVYAQGLVPATYMMLLQGLQIDVDHWRMLFLHFGVIWGLEAARRRWNAQTPLAYRSAS